MSIELSITGIGTLTNLLERLPHGQDAQRLAQRMAVWTTQAHENTGANRKVFPKQLSVLTEAELSDTFGYWSSELIRVNELFSLLDGQRQYLDLLVKNKRALARGKIRKEIEATPVSEETGKKPAKLTVAELNDRAEEDEEVIEVLEVLAMLNMVMASVTGYREACTTATTSLSREISFRQAQFQTRLR